MTISAKITSKGQITVPKEVREALNVGKGDRVVFEAREDGFVVKRGLKNEDRFDLLMKSLDMFSDDFMADGRNQPMPQERPPIFDD